MVYKCTVDQVQIPGRGTVGRTPPPLGRGVLYIYSPGARMYAAMLSRRYGLSYNTNHAMWLRGMTMEAPLRRPYRS